MFDALFQDDTDRALRLEARSPRTQPRTEPGFFSGVGGALWRGPAQAGIETGRAGLNLLEAYGKASALSLGATKEESVDKLFEQSEESRHLGKAARSLDADQATVGTAGQLVQGFSKFAGKAIGYGLSTGPAAPFLFGLDEGVNEGLRLADKGVDTPTAFAAGAVHGVTAGVQVALPVAGKTLAQTTGLVAVGGPLSFIGEQGAIRSILDSAGYEDIAKEYDPTDLLGLGMSIGGPLTFGAAVHGARAVRASRAVKKASAGQPVDNLPAQGTEGARPEPPPHVVDAARTVNLSESSEGRALVKRTDAEGMRQHADAQRAAAEALNEGRAVDVTGVIDTERADLGRAYDLVREQPQGEAFDPLVLIRPDDIEAVAISRGGWGGLGDAEVSGSGFGLVKFIWRHGEASGKAEDVRVTRADVLEFPRVIREFAPSRDAMADGSRGREWRVELPDEQGRSRAVVFAENRVTGAPARQVVSIYVQEPGHPDATRALSQRKSPLSPAPEVGSPAGADTGPGVSLPRSGRSEGADSVAQPKVAEKLDALSERIARIEMHTDEGATMPGEQMVREAEEAMKAAQQDSKAFEAAVSCLLRG